MRAQYTPHTIEDLNQLYCLPALRLTTSITGYNNANQCRDDYGEGGAAAHIDSLYGIRGGKDGWWFSFEERGFDEE